MTQPVPKGAYANLVLAALGFVLSSWAWGLISPLGPKFGQDLDLTSVQQSFLVAVPVLSAPWAASRSAP